MILVQISQTVFINPEQIRRVEAVMTDDGRRLMVYMEDGGYPVTISELSFFNSINSSENVTKNDFEQFKVM